MFTYMGHNNEMSSITMFPSVFIEEHQQPEQLFIEMETTRRVQEINKKSFCCSSSTNSIVAAAAEEALNPNSSVVGVGNGGSCNTTKKPKTSRKRSGKKDRHSKIVTAQGTRDRRMRLSLDIARRFFSLQDMLGFDKASKTVEWLLSKSKHAVKELTRNHCLPDAGNYQGEDKGGGKSMEDMMVMKRAKKKKKMITAGTCMMITSSVLSQGEGLVVDREESRARDRERTLEKTMVPKSNQFTNKQGSMGSASSFEIEDEHCPSSSTNQINKSEDNINNKSIPNFTENWVIDHVTTIPSSSYGNGTHLMHQHLSTTAGNIHEQAVPSSIFTTSSDLCLQSQFPDTQLYAKLWEHYYTHSNLC